MGEPDRGPPSTESTAHDRPLPAALAATLRVQNLGRKREAYEIATDKNTRKVRERSGSPACSYWNYSSGSCGRGQKGIQRPACCRIATPTAVAKPLSRQIATRQRGGGRRHDALLPSSALQDRFIRGASQSQLKGVRRKVE